MSHPQRAVVKLSNVDRSAAIKRLRSTGLMHHCTGSAPGIMVWDGLGFHILTLLKFLLIASAMINQRYMSEISEFAVFPYL
ncbi:hypothetical protein TNCV_1033581 [Trichonephila clavipes]|nr:hypothetical protein TNCV_1033581 [Trichonephila clavipes]